MKITIKNFKPAMSLSEETIAFTGTLYLNGKKQCGVRNSGCGGSNVIDDRAVERRLQAYAAALPGDDSADYLIGKVVDEMVAAAEDKRALANMVRRMKKKVAGRLHAQFRHPFFVVALSDGMCTGAFMDFHKGETVGDVIANLRYEGFTKFGAYDSVTGKKVAV